MKKLLLLALLAASSGNVQGQASLLKGTPLTGTEDLSEKMVAAIDSFLTDKTREIKIAREKEWLVQVNSNNRVQFLNEKRDILKEIWGMTGTRVRPEPWTETDPSNAEPLTAENETVGIRPVKWKVTQGLEMAGVLVEPRGPVKARLVLVPDADQTPEEWAGIQSKNRPFTRHATALQLAHQGVQVLIPAIISRSQEFSGSELLNIYTNQPHREWLYRQGFNLGRHVIGYELLKIASCIDWLESLNSGGSKTPLGIAGYGEGGMLALYTAATDPRISVLLTSGYLGNTEDIWNEPIYRNLQGILKHAAGAELLAMASDHAKVIVEYSESPRVNDPPLIDGRRGGAAPGRLTTPKWAAIEQEVNQALRYQKTSGQKLSLISDNGKPFREAFASATIGALCEALQINYVPNTISSLPQPPHWPDPKSREKSLFDQMEHLIQYELELCERTRNQTFWKEISHDPAKDLAAKKQLRERFHQTIGKITDPFLPPSPRVRLMEANSKWEKYEVVLDVWNGVFAWGVLVVPQAAKEGKPLPVVVCQHGLEGLPDDLITRDTSSRKFKVYKSMALDLAEQGYVTFSPHNPYRGEDRFRVLQRKANPIGLSLFSLITGQHQQIVNWLASLNFVDDKKIGFYGLSYGGKTAMRIPALVEGYALSICSGDFNEWIRKVATTRAPFSYQITKEYEIYEWDLGHRFNYAEMAALIAPRPFMVEFGYKDGIGTAEWIGYEFGKVRKHYDLSGLSGRLDIDLFNGFHEIHGVKTYPFLDKHLKNKGK